MRIGCRASQGPVPRSCEQEASLDKVFVEYSIAHISRAVNTYCGISQIFRALDSIFKVCYNISRLVRLLRAVLLLHSRKQGAVFAAGAPRFCLKTTRSAAGWCKSSLFAYKPHAGIVFILISQNRNKSFKEVRYYIVTAAERTRTALPACYTIIPPPTFRAFSFLFSSCRSSPAERTSAGLFSFGGKRAEISARKHLTNAQKRVIMSV